MIKNTKFIKIYLQNLKKFTSEEYKNKIEKHLQTKINNINNFFYSEYHSSDRVWYKGPLPYYFDINVIFNRQDTLINKIEFIENYLESINKKDFAKENQNIIIFDEYKSNEEIQDQLSNEKIYLSKGFWILENLKLVDKEIFLEDGTIVILKGENSFVGKNKVFKLTGSGMLTQLDGKINISNVKFSKIKNIQIDGLNWSGALNLINAKVSIDNTEIFDNFGEDAINIVGSNSYINNLVVHNAYSDSIDIDFGELEFGKIVCRTSEMIV